MKQIVYTSKEMLKELQSFNFETVEFQSLESKPKGLHSYFKASTSVFTQFLYEEFLNLKHTLSTKLMCYSEDNPRYLLDRDQNIVELGDSQEGLIETGLEFVVEGREERKGFVAQKKWANAQKCFFLDRDGILIKESPYIFEIEKAEVKFDVLDLLKKFQATGWKLVVVTNQSGIARGYFSENQFDIFTKQLDQKIKEYGVNIDDWIFCPFHKEGSSIDYRRSSYLRKPYPGMIFKAQSRNPIQLNGSIMIGDQLTDQLFDKRLQYFHLKSNKSLENAESEVFDDISNFESRALELGFI